MTNRTELTAEQIERSINYMAEMRRLCDTQTGNVPKAYDTALAALRAEQERLNPRPLALDELRRMNGEPVWVRFGTGVENWMLIELEEYQDETKPPYIYLHGVDVKGDGQEYTEEPDPDFYELDDTNGRFGLFTLGWVAYRTKPERGREDA